MLRVQQEEPPTREILTESDPLLHSRRQSGGTSRSRYARRLAVLLCICSLERCANYLSIAMSIDTRSIFETLPNYCGVLGDNQKMLGLNESWIDQLLRSMAYLWPVVGGMLADCWCRCVPVVRFSSALYVVGTSLLALAVYLPMPERVNPFCNMEVKYIYDSILALASGFIRPCILTLAYQASVPLMNPIVFSQLYYIAEAFGQIFAYSIAYGSTVVDVPLTGSSLITACFILALSLLGSGPERRNWEPVELHRASGLPLSIHRIKRLVPIFMPVIIMATGTTLTYFTLNARGIAYFHANLTEAGVLTQRDFMRDSDLMMLIYSVALLASMLLVILVSRTVSVIRSLTVRIGIGLILAILSQLATFLVYRFPHSVLKGHVELFVVFGSLNCLGAASEAFAFSTMNELALLVSPRESRTYTVGLIHSLWGTGFLFSLLIQWISYNQLANNSVSEFFDSIIQWVAVAFACAMSVGILYIVWLVPKAMKFLIDIEANSRREEKEAALASVG